MLDSCQGIHSVLARELAAKRRKNADHAASRGEGGKADKPQHGERLAAKSFRRDILEGIATGRLFFMDLRGHKSPDIPSVSPLKGIFYVGISKTLPLFS